MHDHPAVLIVISSSWQETYSVHQLRALFEPAIEARIIGGTHGADPDREAGTRHEQILKYRRELGHTGPWLALDDAADEFPRSCIQLVLCNPRKGFDEDAETRLRLKLLAIRRHAS
jgi:hypothetical protein